jgi:hypothetical protein
MHSADQFKSTGARLEEMLATREQIGIDAFSMLELELSDLANMLVIGLGDRGRAVRWMCTRHRELDGRNGYQVIADGEAERLWELVEGLCGTPNAGAHAVPASA